MVYRLAFYKPRDNIHLQLTPQERLPFMYLYKVCEKKGYKLFKSLSGNVAVVLDKDNNRVFRGTHYQTNQEFLKLISDKGG